MDALRRLGCACLLAAGIASASAEASGVVRLGQANAVRLNPSDLFYPVRHHLVGDAVHYLRQGNRRSELRIARARGKTAQELAALLASGLKARGYKVYSALAGHAILTSNRGLPDIRIGRDPEWFSDYLLIYDKKLSKDEVRSIVRAFGKSPFVEAPRSFALERYFPRR